MNPVQCEALAKELDEEYTRLRAENAQKQKNLLSLEEARNNQLKLFS